MQELQTLPRGPEAKSAEWFANERLAYSTLAVHLWSTDMDKWITVFSRVLEHTTQYPICVLYHIFDGMDMNRWPEVTIWSDGPKQFKNRTFMSTFTFYFLERYSWSGCTIQYGCPKHFKEGCDRHFAVLRGARESFIKHTALKDLDDVVDMATKHFKQQKAMHPNDPEHLCIHFVPPEKATVKCCTYRLDSFHGLQHCFSWSARRLDCRRRSLLGRGLEKHTVTGIQLRNHVISGYPCRADMQGHPVLESEAGAAAAESCEEDGEENAQGLIPVSSKQFRGWRCSFIKEHGCNSAGSAKRRRSYMHTQSLAMSGFFNPRDAEPVRRVVATAKQLDAARQRAMRKNARAREELKFLRKQAI